MIHFDRKFLRYLFSGLINSIVGYSAAVILLTLIPNIPIALALSTIFGIFFNFIVYSVVGFSVKLNLKKFIKFLVVYSALYVISLMAMNILIIWFPLKIVAYSVFYPIYVFLSFIMLNKFVFKD